MAKSRSPRPRGSKGATPDAAAEAAAAEAAAAEAAAAEAAAAEAAAPEPYDTATNILNSFLLPCLNVLNDVLRACTSLEEVRATREKEENKELLRTSIRSAINDAELYLNGVSFPGSDGGYKLRIETRKLVARRFADVKREENRRALEKAQQFDREKLPSIIDWAVTQVRSNTAGELFARWSVKTTRDDS
ncbi:MAG: hypothetical protein AB7I01_14160 [Gammaproteobacteria bacterium]